MSNYLLLIIDMYNEEIKKDDRFVARNMKAVFKENTVSYMFIIVQILSIIIYFILEAVNFKYSFVSIIIAIIDMLFLIPISQYESQKNYENNIRLYKIKLGILRKILKKPFKLYESKKINELIEQSNKAIEYYKISNQFWIPFTNISKTMILPTVTFAIGVIIKNVELSINSIIDITVKIIIGIFLISGGIYSLKVPIESYLDTKSSKLKKLRNMLIDIQIEDFIKDDK